MRGIYGRGLYLMLAIIIAMVLIGIILFIWNPLNFINQVLDILNRVQ